MTCINGFYPEMLGLNRHEDVCPGCGEPLPVVCLSDGPAECELCEPEEGEDDASLQ